MGRYQHWLSKGCRSSADRCFDISGQVHAVLFDFECDPRVPMTAECTTSVGNGVIMRPVPMVVTRFRSHLPHEIVATIRLSARETHSSVKTEIVTEVLTALLVGALLGRSPKQLMDVSWVSTGQPFDEVTVRVVSPGP